MLNVQTTTNVFVYVFVYQAGPVFLIQIIVYELKLIIEWCHYKNLSSLEFLIRYMLLVMKDWFHSQFNKIVVYISKDLKKFDIQEYIYRLL